MERSIKDVKGIGEVRARQLKALGVETVADMLYYFPRGFEDRTHLVSIFEAQDGETASVFAVATGNIQLSYQFHSSVTDKSLLIDSSQKIASLQKMPKINHSKEINIQNNFIKYPLTHNISVITYNSSILRSSY